MTSKTQSRIAIFITPALAAALTLCAGSATAETDPEVATQARLDADAQARAKVLYRQGTTQYDLGDFQEAIRLFKEAYQIWPYSNLLYNIAQAYRQIGDCEALFFYRRYLSVEGPRARNGTLVEQRIAELLETCQAMEDLKQKPPGAVLGEVLQGEESTLGDIPALSRLDASMVTRIRDGDDRPGARLVVDGRESAIEVSARSRDSADRELLASIAAGPVLLDTGDSSVDGALFGLTGSLTYPVEVAGIPFTVGALATYTPVRQLDAAGMVKTSSMTGILATIGARHWSWGRRVALHGELGVGALILSGLDADSPFVAADRSASSAVSVLDTRASIGVDVALPGGLVFTVSPLIYSYSPARSGMREDIRRLSRFEVMTGIGYRF